MEKYLISNNNNIKKDSSKNNDDHNNRVIESGDIFFFYRPKVDSNEVKDIDDVQRFYMITSRDRQQEQSQK